MAALHHRTNSHKKLASAASKSARPAPLKRGSFREPSKKHVEKSVLIRDTEEQDEEIMALSFLQYCATCERQIIVPSNSVLYCSENCRRKDQSKSLSQYSPNQSPPQSPFHTSPSFEDLHYRDIIPQRSPTVAYNSNRFSLSSMQSSSPPLSPRESLARRDSEAAAYLRQFHSSASLVDHSTIHAVRPKLNRASVSLASSTTNGPSHYYAGAPSLSHTPASSVGTSVPYTPSTSRPLPRRTNPFSTSYSSNIRNADLVNPFAPASSTHATHSTLPSKYEYHHSRVDSGMYQGLSLKCPPSSRTCTAAAAADLSYEKMDSLPRSPGQGSLKQLFRFEEMQRDPTPRVKAGWLGEQ